MSVKLSKTDYTVTYENNKNIGTAYLVIAGKGNYTGTIKTSFLIKAKKGATVTSGTQKFKVTGTSEIQARLPSEQM